MVNEIDSAAMDKLLEALEKKETPAKMSASRAISLYYPRLKAVADKKGLRIRDVYALFRQMNPDARISESSFKEAWYRAGRLHKAKQADGGDGKADEVADKATQAVKQFPKAGSSDEAVKQFNDVPTSSEPVKQFPTADKAGNPVKQFSADKAKTSQAKPGFTTDDDIRAKDAELKRQYGIE